MIQFDLRKSLGKNGFEFRATLTKSITTVIGKSGAGKSTLVNLLSGLLTPDRGAIHIGDCVFFDGEKGINLASEKRGIGMVFQDHRLFPHYSVEQNILFPRTYCRRNNSVDFYELIELLDLKKLLPRRLNRLSGGEAQRVSLGRAVMAAERLLIFDEPLSSLDLIRKSELLGYIKEIPQIISVPVLYITHSLSESAAVSEEALLIHEGKTIALGTPESMFLKLKSLGEEK